MQRVPQREIRWDSGPSRDEAGESRSVVEGGQELGRTVDMGVRVAVNNRWDSEIVRVFLVARRPGHGSGQR
jgi:hypothetical protein